MFGFVNKKEPCRGDAQQTVFLVMFSAFLYTVFRMYRNFEDEMGTYTPQTGDTLTYSKNEVFTKYFTSIFHFTASFKCLPAFVAAFQVFRMNKKARGQVKIRTGAANSYAFYIILGMMLCAGGDYWLEIDNCKDDRVVYEFMRALNSPVPPFLIGLVSFLLGHIAFIFAFYHDGGNSVRFLAGLFLYAYGIAIVYVILTFGHVPDHDKVLKVGIAAYSAIIATMCHRSFSFAFDAYPGLESPFYAVLGSITFLVSDTLLAYNRFIAPIPFGRISTLFTYFLALGLIASSSAGTMRWKIGWD